MYIGLNSGIFPADWHPTQKVEATARVGAVGMELNIDATQLWTQRLDQNSRRTLLQNARDAGVKITSVCLNAHWVFNLTSPNPQIRALGASILIDGINLAADLDAKAVLVPGCDQEESPANKWELFRDGVIQGIDHAQQAGVKLALEAVGKPFLFNSATLLEMIAACGGSDVLGIYLDVGNATHGSMDPAHEILTAGQRSILVHVKDWNPANPVERLLGKGAVNFSSSLDALRTIGYDGPLIVELPPAPEDPDLVARHSVAFMKEALHG